jgi:glycosyltransferase involved in cell wall biosynthesis
MNDMPQTLHVLQVTARYLPYTGGIETHVAEVARRMAVAGAQVTILTTDPSRSLPVHEQVAGVEIRRVPAWPAQRDYYLAPDLYRLIRAERWDIMHCQGYHTFVPLVALAAARRAHLPFVVSFHSGGHSSGLRNTVRGLQLALLRPFLRRAARLIAVSRFEASTFRHRLRFPAEQFSVIPNGATLPPAAPGAPATNAGPLIISLGRLERYKGHQRVLAALPQVLACYPTAHLRLLGAGPYAETLQQLARRLGIQDRFTIAPIPETDGAGLAGLLQQAALVISLSDYESQSIAVWEAVALGCSVLVADATALHEVVAQGLARGISLASTDSEVAEAIKDQIQHPIHPAPVSLPTWDGCATQLLALYQSILGKEQASCGS